MNVDSGWKGLYDLLNDLIRQEESADLEASLCDNINSLIPADKGAGFFQYYEAYPHCVKWPDYASSLVPDFNSHYGKVCPVPFRMKDMMMGPVSWRRYHNTEYDTDFNHPLNIGHSMAVGFRLPQAKFIHIIALNRSQESRGFSQHEAQNLKLLSGLFAQLYQRIEHTEGCIENRIQKANLRLGMAPLSPRETEICALICRRYTAREIAEHLQISTRTVECHYKHIYYKMNVANRGELLRLIFSTDS
ncbi:MAG: LuxR C-terminal-related transcriptional regulator [Spirochaetia bacterium]|nr:LuxR C-terminal-related transcriptional regulator [Spirochaetia bacterium]